MLRFTMPNTKLKRNILLVFSGLMFGLLMPFVEYIAVFLADDKLFRFRQIFVNDGYVMGDPWLSVVFVLVEITSLLFLARLNRIFAAAALTTATAATVVLLEIWSRIPDLP